MITASNPITSWQIEGEKIETVIVFILLGSKITVDSVCSHEIKRSLPLERKTMRNSILKCRDITADKSPYHQNYVRHHIKTWELDHKEYWPLKRLFFWPANRSKQLILKGINPEYSLEGLMLKLKFQCIGYLMQSNDSLENILRLRKIEGRRRRGDTRWDGWIASLTQWTWVRANSGR